MNSRSTCTLLSIACIIWLFSSSAFSACDFDTDDADSPNFVEKIIACDAQEKADMQRKQKTAEAEASKLYGDGTLDRASGMLERPIVAAGSMNHTANKAFAARQSYSLRPGAKFEQSVTLAIQRLQVPMAHHGSRASSVKGQWSEPDPKQEGDYFLHYRFNCAT